MDDKVLKALFSILVLTSFMSGLAITGSSFNLNPSQIASLILLIGLVLYSLINRKSIALFTDNVSLFIYLYFFSNLFSSLLFSPVKIASLKGCAVILSYIIIYMVTRWALKFAADKKAVVKRLMKYNLLMAILGLLCMVAAFAYGSENFGVSYGHLAQSGVDTIQSPIPSIKSLSVEPNLFAIITAAIFALNLSIYFFWKKSRGQLLTIIIIAAALVFSYTRSVYISLFISLLVLLALSNKMKQLVSLINVVLIAVVVSFAAYSLLPANNDLKNAIASRTSSLFEFNKGSGAGRAQAFQISIDGFLKNPLFGNGTLSADTQFFNIYRMIYQERMGSAGWLNGVFIQSLHDTGLIGLLIVFCIYFFMIAGNYRAFKRLPATSEDKCIALGFLAGNIILLISSQLSSTLWVAFPYIYWGINVAFIKSQQEARHENWN